MGLFDALNFARRKKYPEQSGGWNENVMIDGVPVNATNIALPRRLRELVAQNPSVGVGSDNEDDSSFENVTKSLLHQNPTTQALPPTDTPAPAFTPIDPLQRQSTPTPDAVDESTPARNPSLDFSRNAPRFEPVQLDKMPIEARQAQQRATKPVYRDTGNPREDTTRYEQELLNWRNPLDRNGRLKSGAKMALQGFARGVASTGSIAGGIGGAAAGFGYGAIQPNVDERQWRDEEAARTGQRRVAFDAIQTKDLQRRKLETDIENTQADTYRKQHPEPKDPKTFQGADGLQYTLSSDGKTATEVQGQGRKTTQPKVLHTVNRGSKVWYETEEGLKPALDPTTGKQIKSDLVPVKLQNGQRIWVTPAEALRAVTEGRHTANSTRNSQSLRDFQTQTRAIDKENQRTEREYNEAWNDAERFNKLHDEVDKMYEGFQSATKKADKDYYNAEALRLKAQMNSLYSSLMDKYKGTNYIQYDDTERFVRGTRPEPKEYPDAPELTFDEGVQVEGDGDGEETPPAQTARPRARGQSASPSGPPWTEEQVRARAKARGKNEDAAVEAARKKGQLK